MFFKQIKQEGDNFSYVVADETTREAVVVDPSFNVDEIIRVVRNQNLSVRYIINTHSHFDHTAGNKDLKLASGAKLVAHKLAPIEKDTSVADGDNLKIGKITMKVIHTPGHTPDSICLLFDNKLITGDTLFIGECGRTDLPGGSVEEMHHSLFDKLLKLDDTVE